MLRSNHPLYGLYFIFCHFHRGYLSWGNYKTGGFSPLFPAVTSTFGICPSVLFIYWIIKSERFHLTFKVFIFTSCMSTIHLSLSAFWGTMLCLALFSKVNRELCRALCTWGSSRFVQCPNKLLVYLLELLEVSSSVSSDPHGFQIDSWLNFLVSKPQRCALKFIKLTEGDGHSAIFMFLLFISRQNL